ncbi:MAG TPA: hypothetical protein G4O19_00080, partial [Dehalococcoidia bacterium]|nr:hypothetical protein [Dehalococcoidia bacterium]
MAFITDIAEVMSKETGSPDRDPESVPQEVTATRMVLVVEYNGSRYCG